MIDISKSFSFNKNELDRMLAKEVRSERDIYNTELCITYLNRLILVETDAEAIANMTKVVGLYKEKLERHKDEFKMQEKLIRDLEKYRYEDLPKSLRIHKDASREKAFQVGFLVLFTALVGGIAFINIDVAFIILLIQLIYLFGVVYWCVLDKRLFYLAPVKLLSMLGDKDRAYRDSVWKEVMKYFFKEDTDVYKVINGLKDDLASNYTIELLHEKYIEVSKEVNKR